MNKNTLKQVLERTQTALRPSAVKASLTARIPWKWGYRPNLDILIWKSIFAYFRATDSWEPCEWSLAHSSALQLDTHCSERTADTRNAVRCMLHRLSHATDYGTSTQTCFRCQQISRRVLHAPASTPTGMQPYPTRGTPPQPIPTPSIARMQLLHPPLRCSKQMQIILVTGRKHIDASAFTNIFVPGRW